MGLIIIHGLGLLSHLIFSIVWSSFLLGKHKKVKLFYVTTFFFHISCEELKTIFLTFT
jgi:hypothetical protein